MPSPRVTQKDIARHLGLTQATVSLALSNHPGVRSETREKVLQTAKELGYVADPYLSGLSAYRKSVQPAHFQGMLAWLSNYPENASWRKTPVFKRYFEGAVRRAEQLGYGLKEYRLHTEGMTSSRMENILVAQNIRGLLVAPQPDASLTMDFCFRRFSAVTFGYTLTQPQLNLVTSNQYRSMEALFRKLLALGYKRPGFAMADYSDQRADHNWSAAFLSEQRLLPARNRVPLLLPKQFDQEVFIEWHKKHRPDVVVALWPEVKNWLEAAGESVPESTGLVLFSLTNHDSEFSGMWENSELIGAKAVEFLIEMIHRGESGVPEVPICVLVDGTWVQGKTVRTIS